MTRTKPPTYPASMRWLHWASVVAVVAVVALGFAQEGAGASRVWLLRAHLLFGVVVVASTLVRVFVRRRAVLPPPLPMPAWRGALVRIVHGALYLTLLALGLTGVGTALAGGLGPVMLGSASSVPDLEGLIPREAHVTLVLAFLVSLGLHVAGVMAYQAREGDALGRMMGRAMPSGGDDAPAADSSQGSSVGSAPGSGSHS